MKLRSSLCVLALAVSACTDDPSLEAVGGGRAIHDVPDAAPDAGRDGSVGCIPPADLAAPLPCEIEATLTQKCQRCHDEPAALADCLEGGGCFQAPFPLRSLADVHGLLGSRLIYEAMFNAVDTGFMPLQSSSLEPPVEPLDSAERDRLLGWLAACAPAGEMDCN